MTKEQLKGHRQKAGMTQKEVAEALGLPGDNGAHMVSRWECGKRKINAVTAKALLSVLTKK